MLNDKKTNAISFDEFSIEELIILKNQIQEEIQRREPIQEDAISQIYKNSANELNRSWQTFLDTLKKCIEQLNHQLELDDKYFATAEKKGKTPEQIRKREKDHESHKRSLKQYEAELSHYLKLDVDIQVGNIQPHFTTHTTSSGFISVEATYLLPMPDNTPGFYDDKLMLVRKLR